MYKHNTCRYSGVSFLGEVATFATSAHVLARGPSTSDAGCAEPRQSRGSLRGDENNVCVLARVDQSVSTLSGGAKINLWAKLRAGSVMNCSWQLAIPFARNKVVLHGNVFEFLSGFVLDLDTSQSPFSQNGSSFTVPLP